MTIMEKAAYLRGLCDGMDFQADSREAKLWGVLTELLSDVVHEIEDLKTASVDMSETLDDLCQDVALLEEMADDMDMSPFDDSWGDDDDDDDEELDEGKLYRFPRWRSEDDEEDGDAEGADEQPDEEPEDDAEDDADEDYDGIVYDVTCPSCGEKISFDEETLETGSIQCPSCGELLQFELGDEDEPDDET